MRLSYRANRFCGFFPVSSGTLLGAVNDTVTKFMISNFIIRNLNVTKFMRNKIFVINNFFI